MHIPDGYLSTEVCIATSAVSLGAVAWSLRRLRSGLADRTIPLTGMMGSLIFAGQMVNFPIGGLVSGHLMGGVLAAAVLGPWGGCIAITLVLVTQWALFSDGGLTVLGANILHMGIVGAIGGYAVAATIRRMMKNSAAGVVIGVVIASWLSVMAAAALFCFEFRISHNSEGFDFRNIFALMVSLHSLIGLGEAAITGVIVGVILQQRPDLIHGIGQPVRSGSVIRILAAGLTVALAVAAFISPFASEYSDGLEAVAERHQIEASEPVVAGVFRDYDAIDLGGWQVVSVSVAGIGGTLMVFVMACLLSRLRPVTGGSVQVQPES